MGEKKEKIYHVRLTDLEAKRLLLLAGERGWTISHLLRYIIECYTDVIFEKNSIEYRDNTRSKDGSR